MLRVIRAADWCSWPTECDGLEDERVADAGIRTKETEVEILRRHAKPDEGKDLGKKTNEELFLPMLDCGV